LPESIGAAAAALLDGEILHVFGGSMRLPNSSVYSLNNLIILRL
jgi:hypothetical protein